MTPTQTPTETPLTAVWVRHAMDSHRWLRDHGALPLRRAGGSPDERMLGGWLSDQRTAVSRGTLTAQQAEILDAWVPTWRVGRHALWLRSIAERSDTIDAGEEPSTPPGLVRRLHPDERQILDLLLGPSLADQQTEHFRRRLSALVAWVGVHGRFPVNSSSADENEKSLAHWWRSQRRRLACGELSPERKQALDAALPSWNHASGFEIRLGEVAAVAASTGRWPTTARNSPTRSLGLWWVQVRVAARRPQSSPLRMSPMRRAILDMRIPSWREQRPRKES